MSQVHTGNTQPSISQEEHDHAVNPATKRVLPYGYDGTNKNLLYVDTNGIQRSIVSIAHPISTTLGGNMTLNPSPNFIGLTTTVIGSAPTIFAVVNTAAAGQSSVVLDTGTNWIGLATTVIGSSPTLYAVVNTAAAGVQNSLTTLLGSSAFIGLVTVANTVTELNSGSIKTAVEVIDNAISGTEMQVDVVASLPAGTNAIGKLAANSGVDIGDVDILSIAAGNNNIGDVDVASIAAGDNNIGNVDVVTLPALAAGTAQIGSVTVANPITFGSNVSLNASNAWIGLATIVPDYGSNVTVHTGIYSAAGAATVFIAPASNRFWLTSLHMASLGRSEVEIRSGATTLIPFTSLATTGGYVHDFAPPGLPSRAQADAFVVNIASTATISVMASWYAKP